MTTQLYQPHPYKVRFDTQQYPFRELVNQMLNISDLSMLHQIENYAVFKRETDQSSSWHRKFYDHFQAVFQPVYVDFVRAFIAPEFGIDFSNLIFQRIPTFRIQLVNNVSVGEWHRDRDYNHGSSEINFWMPFTDTYDTNTVWMETEEGKEDIQPFEVQYGEILCFRGADLLHGNHINQTQHTRVSVDFRIVHRDRFIPSHKGSINTGVKFDLGGYFDCLAPD